MFGGKRNCARLGCVFVNGTRLKLIHLSGGIALCSSTRVLWSRLSVLSGLACVVLRVRRGEDNRGRWNWLGRLYQIEVLFASRPSRQSDNRRRGAGKAGYSSKT